ncbi:hypothetical protein HZC53_03790 [Candidatus Uhrbacteria bacterium]|nr:hypothetical protein [Candidatus Uhrbacteria bacterium]
MIDFKVEKRTVNNGGGSLTCDMGVLVWGDLLMLEKQPMLRPKRKTQDAKIKAGSFWRPNRELEDRTDGDATHAHHDDAYLLQAAGEHVILTEEFEVEEMRQRIAEAADFSTIMLDYRAMSIQELTDSLESQAARVESLSAVRDGEKVAAREMMAETLDLTDSTGKINPMAKAMQSGGANGRFRKRLKNAQAIRNREMVRTKQVSDMIVEHLHQYSLLWSMLSMRATPEKPGGPEQVFDTSASLSSGFECLLSETRGNEGLEAAESRLKRFLEVFSSIRIRPFCKNAAHVVRELKSAIRLCREANRAGLMSLLRKLRRGIRWIFALDDLQMKVILPLSILLERLRRLIKRERGKNGTFTKGPIVITRAAAPLLFGKIEDELKLIRQKVREKCRDDELRRSIKEDVEMYLGTAQAALKKDDWQMAKSNLLRAARCI